MTNRGPGEIEESASVCVMRITSAWSLSFDTHMCVSPAARAALDLGIQATVIASAALSRDLPDPQMIPAETVHRMAMTEIADRFATFVPDIAAIVKRAARSRPLYGFFRFSCSSLNCLTVAARSVFSAFERAPSPFLS